MERDRRSRHALLSAEPGPRCHEVFINRIPQFSDPRGNRAPADRECVPWPSAGVEIPCYEAVLCESRQGLRDHSLVRSADSAADLSETLIPVIKGEKD